MYDGAVGNMVDVSVTGARTSLLQNVRLQDPTPHIDVKLVFWVRPEQLTDISVTGFEIGLPAAATKLRWREGCPGSRWDDANGDTDPWSTDLFPASMNVAEGSATTELKPCFYPTAGSQWAQGVLQFQLHLSTLARYNQRSESIEKQVNELTWALPSEAVFPIHAYVTDSILTIDQMKGLPPDAPGSPTQLAQLPVLLTVCPTCEADPVIGETAETGLDTHSKITNVGAQDSLLWATKDRPWSTVDEARGELQALLIGSALAAGVTWVITAARARRRDPDGDEQSA
ncbi:hypothetical protein OMK64_14480 [Cellulomonas fimi]|uniref:hypothetical protein n=1 Tax=Cellulomonas fimi TaxID=1708 RepID=UPI00234DCB1C|nr:hypothetical protein [Cellulomonas fimi]MDC7122739.1 hypothetical protein [Cellulomonas fimi]